MLLFPLQLQSGHPLDEMSIAFILRDLLHAIEYLHVEGKIHRDIKGSKQPYTPFKLHRIFCKTEF